MSFLEMRWRALVAATKLRSCGKSEFLRIAARVSGWNNRPKFRELRRKFGWVA